MEVSCIVWAMQIEMRVLLVLLFPTDIEVSCQRINNDLP